MTVYVRWYGKVLEGELLEGESMGMKQVRIPLDGHHPIALFMPDHVYETAEQVNTTCSKIAENRSKIAENVSECNEIVPKAEIVHLTEVAYWGADTPTNDRQSIEAFKQANWDQERNHLLIDKLDEFYKLWRKTIAEERGYRDYPYPPHPFVPPWNDWNNGIKPQPIAPQIQQAIKEAKSARKKILKEIDSKQLSLFD